VKRLAIGKAEIIRLLQFEKADWEFLARLEKAGFTLSWATSAASRSRALDDNELGNDRCLGLVLDLLGIPPDREHGYCRDGWPDIFEKMVVEDSDFEGFINAVLDEAKQAKP
jgi:hypothetical protein